MKKLSLGFIAFLQAAGLVLYCGLMGLFIINGEGLFGPMLNFLGPALFLIIFVISAIICALIFGTYPFILFWEQKDTKKALRLVAYTTAWLAAFILLILISLLFLK